MEREGDVNCHHIWLFGIYYSTFEPPTIHKMCKLCGRIEHDFSEDSPGKEMLNQVKEHLARNVTMG